MNIFDTIAGLPLHPLVIHFVVVLLPLCALSLALSAFWPWWRDRLATVSFIGLTVAVGLSVVAKESGERLAAHVGTPREHAEWADVLVPVAAVLWVVAAVWILLRWRGVQPPRVAAAVVGVALAGLALGVSGLVALVGHTGAQATWADAVASTTPITSTTQPAGGSGEEAEGSDETPSASRSAAATAPAAGATAGATASGYTMAQVAKHAGASSCWTAIGTSVYDLTSWVNAHPGGQQPILGLCGTDGTAAFTQQHGGQGKPEKELASFRIGPLR